MSTLFISDLHLSGDRPDMVKLFVEFIESQASRAETLYILGDLFDAWIGDDYVDPALQPVIQALHDVAQSGTAVFVMHGNRDFLMADGFEKMSGTTLIEDPSIIDLYGTPTLLMHGDTLCTDDVDYQQMRKQFHDPRWQKDVLSRSVEKRLAFAQQAREESKRETSKKADAIMDVNQKAVRQALKEHGVIQLIHGHTHRPNTHVITIDGQTATRTVLGDWYDHGYVLHCDSSSCRVKTVYPEK